jgi:hypothetical protein
MTAIENMMSCFSHWRCSYNLQDCAATNVRSQMLGHVAHVHSADCCIVHQLGDAPASRQVCNQHLFDAVQAR